MNDKRKEVLEVALDKLKEELQRGPMISPDRVEALTYAIKALEKISPSEQGVAALERQLAEQPEEQLMPEDSINGKHSNIHGGSMKNPIS